MLLLRTERLIDGTGAPERPADVLITGGRIASVAERIDVPSSTEIVDLGELALAPGFIDSHTHSDQAAIDVPDAAGRLYDGVTTEITGNCGGSAFPLEGEVLKRRTSAEWRDLDGYAAAVESAGSAIHHAPLFGHGTLRACVVGYDDRPATPQEIERMVTLAREAMRQGAFGFSTGLIYSPSLCASTDELVAIAAEVARWGGVHASHMRNESNAIEEAIGEHLDIARQSGIRTVISHLKLMKQPNWGKIDWLDETLHAARRDGIDLWADVYPYEASHTGLKHYALPAWAIRDGDPLKILRDEAGRRRIVESLRRDFPDPWEHYGAIQLCQLKSDAYRSATGQRLADVARQRGADPIELALDIIDTENDSATACFFGISAVNMRRILTWPFVMVGSDSSVRSLESGAGTGYVHPRTFGTHATVLGPLSRDEGVVALPEAIRKMTSLVAGVFGLAGRGRIEPGAFADLTVFDPQTVAPGATWADPCRYSTGIPHVMVAGQWALWEGKLTGKRNGRLFRHGRHNTKTR